MPVRGERLRDRRQVHARSPPASRASIFSPKAANCSGLGALGFAEFLQQRDTPALSLPTAALIFSGRPGLLVGRRVSLGRRLLGGIGLRFRRCRRGGRPAEDEAGEPPVSFLVSAFAVAAFSGAAGVGGGRGGASWPARWPLPARKRRRVRS